MAVEQTGAAQNFQISTTAASFQITVPEDAEICCIFVNGYAEAARSEDSLLASLNFDNGSTLDFTTQAVGDNDNDPESQVYTMDINDVNWPGTGTHTVYAEAHGYLHMGICYAVYFFKNINLTAPVSAVGALSTSGNATYGTAYFTGTVGANDLTVACTVSYQQSSSFDVDPNGDQVVLELFDFWHNQRNAIVAKLGGDEISVASGSYVTIAGLSLAPSQSTTENITCTTGEIVYTAFNATVQAGVSISCSSAVENISTAAAYIITETSIYCGSATLSVVPGISEILNGDSVACNVTNVQLSVSACDVIEGVDIDCGLATLSVVPGISEVLNGDSIDCDLATLSVVPGISEVLNGDSITCNVTNVQLSVSACEILNGDSVACDVADIRLNVGTCDVIEGVDIYCDTYSLTLTPHSVTLGQYTLIECDIAHITCQSPLADVVQTENIECAQQQIGYTVSSVNVALGITVNCVQLAYTVAGFVCDIVLDTQVECNRGTVNYVTTEADVSTPVIVDCLLGNIVVNAAEIEIEIGVSIACLTPSMLLTARVSSIGAGEVINCTSPVMVLNPDNVLVLIGGAHVDSGIAYVEFTANSSMVLNGLSVNADRLVVVETEERTVVVQHTTRKG